MNALYIIPILAILILIHEIGHFTSARLVGIRVKEFGLGLPPKLFGWTRNGVLWSLNAIPLGGFVRVHGEDGNNFDSDSMNAKGPGKRAFFLVAGSGMNFILAIILITGLVAYRGESVNNVYVANVEPDSPAAEAGWQPGDQFVEVAGTNVDDMNAVVEGTESNVGNEMSVTVLRNGEEIETTVTPRENPPENQGRTGIQLTAAPAATITIESVDDGSPADVAGLQAGDEFISIAGLSIDDSAAMQIALQQNLGETVPVEINRDGSSETVELAVPESENDQPLVDVGASLSQDVQSEPIPWWQVVPRGLSETWTTITGMFEGLMMLIRGEAPMDGVAGPIGMGQLTSEVLEISPEPKWVTLTNLTILLSLNLGILNLLPIPALDGGRLVFVAVEAIRGKRVPPEKEGVVHFVGLVVLLLFMVFVAFLDVDRLISGQSLLP